MEPQKPVNLPEIKLTKQQLNTNIENSMRQQSVWSTNKQPQHSEAKPSGPGRMQFNYFTDRHKGAQPNDYGNQT